MRSPNDVLRGSPGTAPAAGQAAPVRPNLPYDRSRPSHPEPGDNPHAPRVHREAPEAAKAAARARELASAAPHGRPLASEAIARRHESAPVNAETARRETGAVPNRSRRASAASEIGKIAALSGPSITCVLNDVDSVQNALEHIQIGSIVRFTSSVARVYGLILGVTDSTPDQSRQTQVIFETIVIGEVPFRQNGERKFEQGVTVMPSITSPVHPATQEDLDVIYAPPNEAAISVGTLHQNPNITVHVMADRLIGSHVAILGTTGSGKSCATTILVRQIISAYPHGHVVLLDPHNEYTQAFGDIANALSTKNLHLPYWLLTIEELLFVLFGGRCDTGSTEAEILGDAIPRCKAAFLGSHKVANMTADAPFPYRLSDLQQYLQNQMVKMTDAEDRRPYRNILGRLLALQSDARYDFMFGSFDTRDRMGRILAELLRVPVEDRPLTILDLSGIPSDVVSIVVGVVARLMFDLAVWSDRSMPTMLICEEAHRYSPAETGDHAAALSRKALATIAKEGRKYGVSLCVVSQRPTKLSSDLLSQCNSLVALRMSNTEDQDAISGAMLGSLDGILSVLPALRNGEAIILGQGVTIPYRATLHRLQDHEQPRSNTVKISEHWAQDGLSHEYLNAAINRWRSSMIIKNDDDSMGRDLPRRRMTDWTDDDPDGTYGAIEQDPATPFEDASEADLDRRERPLFRR